MRRLRGSGVELRKALGFLSGMADRAGAPGAFHATPALESSEAAEAVSEPKSGVWVDKLPIPDGVLKPLLALWVSDNKQRVRMLKHATQCTLEVFGVERREA